MTAARYVVRPVASEGEVDRYQVVDTVRRATITTLRWKEGAESICRRLNENAALGALVRPSEGGSW